jgi:uncharacterized protein YeaO (DUF488 family)
MLYINYLANIKNTPEGVKKYLIVRIPPKHFNFFQNPDIKHMPQLSPSQNLLYSYKNKKISFDQFKEKFAHEIENRQDMKQAIEELVRDLNRGEDICLICYEEDSNECHRKIIADFIKDKHGIDYIDIKKEENPYKQLSLWDFEG